MKFKLSVNDIKQSTAGRWASEFCNKSWVAKTIVVGIIWLIASIPFDLYLLVRWGIGPNTFWEELALIVAVSIVIGWIQAILLFFAIILSLVVIFDDL